MPQITIVIPTARRPEMLVTALTSVRSQTALVNVDRVIVSENAGDPSSREVCARFPELPIHYVLQDPPLTPVRHVHHLLTRPDLGEYLAFLCDDDWWAPGHLATLLAALEQNPDAVGAFTAFLYTESETSIAGQFYWPAAMWLRAGAGQCVARQRFGGDEVLASCWVSTPFHFSAMMLRTGAVREVAEFTRDMHPAHADRLLFARLAMLGPSIFEPLPSVFVRRHSGNYCRYTPQRELDRSLAEGRQEVAELARSKGHDVAQVWRRLLEPRPHEVPPQLLNLFWDYASREAVEAAGLMPYLSRGRFHYWLKRFERASWQVLVPLAPPILHRAYVRTRDRFAAGKGGARGGS